MKLLASDVDEIVSGLGPEFWAKFAGKRVLLTGARGFLGRYFTEVFVRANEVFLSPYTGAAGSKALGQHPVEVVALDNLIASGAYGNETVERPGVSFVQHDVIEPFVPERPIDFVLHAAGIASPFYYRKFPLQTADVSTKGTRNALEIARRNPGCRLLYFSSSEIYGDPDAKHVPTAESYRGYVSCLGDRAVYDEGKRFGEMLVKVYHEQFGVSGSMVRPFNFYGPGMQRTDYRVLPNFAARWVEGRPLHVYGDGTQTRTFCYVTDGIRGCLQALVRGAQGEPYNVGNPSPEISMRDLAKLVGRITNQDVRFDTVEHPDTYPADEPQRRCPDISKARAQLGYEPRVSLEDGLKRFFDWANVAFREP